MAFSRGFGYLVILNGNGGKWKLQKEKILMAAGLIIIGYESIVVGFLSQPFHGEVLIAGGALCGLSIAQWKDKQ